MEGEAIAVIDVGTNSIKVCVASKANGGIKYDFQGAIITRLGKGFREGMLQDEPVEKSVEAVKELASAARKNGAKLIVAVGTEGLRNAKNRMEFVDRIRGRVDFFAVITGEYEAKLSIFGAMGHRTEAYNVVEIGGGSVQISAVREKVPLHSFSKKIGVVALYEKFVHHDPPDETEMAELSSYVCSQLQGMEIVTTSPLLFIGGTARIIAQITSVEGKFVDGATVLVRKLEDLKKYFYKITSEDRVNEFGIEPGRADIIVAGAELILAICKSFGRDRFEVSAFALRHGLANLILENAASALEELKKNSILIAGW